MYPAYMCMYVLPPTPPTHTGHHSETATNLTRVGSGPGENTVIVHDDKKPSRGSQTESFISELMLLLR